MGIDALFVLKSVTYCVLPHTLLPNALSLARTPMPRQLANSYAWNAMGRPHVAEHGVFFMNVDKLEWASGQQTFQPLALRDQTPVRLPAGRHFLNVLCYVRSELVDLGSCETLHLRTLKKISDSKPAV